MIPMKDQKEMDYFAKSMENPYDVKQAPEGYLNMLIAENTLMQDVLFEKLQKIGKDEKLPFPIQKYGNMYG